MSDQILDEALKMFEPKQTAPTINEYAVRAASDDCAITLNRLAGGLERIYSSTTVAFYAGF